MAPKQDADLFNKIIADGRARKQNETIAKHMLGSGRRFSAPNGLAARKDTAGSLASRVGISKAQRAGSALSRPASARPSNNRRAGDALASHMLGRTASEPRLKSNAPVANPPGFTFRGKAQGGEFVYVIAQNFAPGTTAADIESVIQPMVDEEVECKIVTTTPTIIAQLQFRSRSNADRVVQKFNNKMADGRKLYVYNNNGINAFGGFASPPGPSEFRGGPRQEEQNAMYVDGERDRHDEQRRYDEERRNTERRAEVAYQDGSYGFDESRGNRDVQPSRAPRAPLKERSGQGLYSDNIPGSRGTGRRGNFRGR